jgi:hypothetical protein
MRAKPAGAQRRHGLCAGNPPDRPVCRLAGTQGSIAEPNWAPGDACLLPGDIRLATRACRPATSVWRHLPADGRRPVPV